MGNQTVKIQVRFVPSVGVTCPRDLGAMVKRTWQQPHNYNAIRDTRVTKRKPHFMVLSDISFEAINYLEVV